jgi:DNA modification methylase
VALKCGDNLVLLRGLEDETADLAYLDPPFFSERSYAAEAGTFDDRWGGNLDGYIRWMEDRVRQVHRVLKPTGSLYLHCDWHASHALKVMLDEVFGQDRFQNEIVWYYRGGGVSPRRWGRRHDVLLFYSKGSNWIFNVDPVRTAYSTGSQERLRHTARAFRKGQDGTRRVYDNYRPNPKGKHPDDVWEIPAIAPSSRERIGYPTQKPEALLERLILASSNPGDLILDPFCGSGTTLAVAERTGRRWVGFDENPDAVWLAQARLQSAPLELVA